MNIILEKKNIKTFADVEIGEVFFFNNEFYMKIANPYALSEKDTEFNAVKMSSGYLDTFSDYIEIQKVNSQLRVKLL